jgi:hypothetical protein
LQTGKELSRYVTAPGLPSEIAFCVKSFFVPHLALPADYPLLVGGAQERVVVVDLPVAFGTNGYFLRILVGQIFNFTHFFHHPVRSFRPGPV